MKKIGIISPDFDLIGGAQEHIAQLAERLPRYGFEVTVITPDFGEPYRHQGKAEIRRLSFPTGHLRGRIARGHVGRSGVRKILDPIFPLFFIVAVLNEVRKRGLDLLHIHGFFSPAIPAWLSDYPYIVTFHGQDATRALNGTGLQKIAMSRVIRGATHLITVSPYISNALEANYRKSPPISYIPNGVPIPGCEWKKPSRGKFLICCAGRLERVKGFDILIRALGELSSLKIHVNFYGDGPERESLIELAEHLGIRSTITFHGNVEKCEVLESARKSNLIVIPSRDEGLPMFLLEALSLSCPVIGTDVGLMGDILREATGRALPPEDPVLLSDAIRDSIQNPNQLEEYGRSGRDIVKTNFSINKMVERVVQIYNECI